MITDKNINTNQSDQCHQCSCSKTLDEDAKAESYYLMKAHKIYPQSVYREGVVYARDHFKR